MWVWSVGGTEDKGMRQKEGKACVRKLDIYVTVLDCCV